jgi:3-deoxy-manno-octulosonate cytidylyltransferase (CMP-KDO synthetase)
MTSPDCASGTDRIAEAVKKIADSGQRIADRKSNKLSPKPYPLSPNDIIVNLQADEPEIDPEHIDLVAQLLVDHAHAQMATIAADFQTAEQIADPNIVKVIVTSDQRPATSDEIGSAIYFSRYPIPYDRESSGIGDTAQHLRHIGIYAYRKDFLLKLTAMPQAKLEKIEKLEQLRPIENGFKILVGKVTRSHDGIDTPAQYAEFVKREERRN